MRRMAVGTPLHCESGRKLRIAQLLPTAGYGGAERIACSLARALAQRSHSVEMVCPGGPMARELSNSSVVVTRKGFRNLSRFATAFSLAIRFRAEPVDIIHAHLSRGARVASVVSRLTGIPVVTTVHTARRSDIYLRLATGANRIIAVSDYVRSVLLEWGVPNGYVERIYNGTDIDGIPQSNRTTLSAIGITCDRKIIGFVGRVIRAKGSHELLEAFVAIASEDPSTHLVLAGGFEKESFSKVQSTIASKELSDRVSLLGPREDVAALMAGFDLIVLPSHREAFGLALVEAMARGVPVIATRVGGLPEVVDDGVTGILVEPGVDELTEAIRYMIANPDRAAAMGRAGKDRVRELFSLENMAQQYESTYFSVLNSHL